MSLKEAIEQVDESMSQRPLYFMINSAPQIIFHKNCSRQERVVDKTNQGPTGKFFV